MGRRHQYPEAKITVEVREGSGTGSLIETLTADQFSASISGEHGFHWEIPTCLRTGTNRTLHFIALNSEDGSPAKLSDPPKTFNLFPLSKDGRDFFNTSIRDRFMTAQSLASNPPPAATLAPQVGMWALTSWRLTGYLTHQLAVEAPMETAWCESRTALATLKEASARAVMTPACKSLPGGSSNTNKFYRPPSCAPHKNAL